MSLIQARSHTVMEIDHEIISTVILLHSTDSFKKSFCLVFSYKGKYVHEVLVIPLSNFVCGGYTVFTLSVRASVRP